MRILTRALLLILSLIWLAGCKTTPQSPNWPEPDSKADPTVTLKSALGMSRDPADLGFVEKPFNPCTYGLNSTGSCKNQYFSVVHFQLLCRDSEGSVSSAPIALQPIVASNVQWKVGSISGGTYTDSNGYGQFSLVSSRPARGQRLILRIGPQFVAFTVSEVSKVVLPKNFCRS